MTNVNEGLPDPDEGFHEETPAEYADQPDRDFGKVPVRSEDQGGASPAKTAAPGGSTDAAEDQQSER
jgi:hypothetical protein